MQQLIEETILKLAGQRGPDKTICPSEVARQLFPADWRLHMPEIRQSAFNLQAQGKVLITQRNQAVTSRDLKGPLRIRINS